MKDYKVWIEIEEHDSETDEYRNVDLLYFPATADFDSDEAAQAFANRLHEVGLTLIELLEDLKGVS